MLVREIEPDAQSMNLDSNLFYKNASGTRDTIMKSKDTLDLIIDSPCLEACKYLYDCNVLTVNSSANKTNSNRGYITIQYSSLSDYNKQVVDKLVEEKIIQLRDDFDKDKKGETFDITIPINENTTVEEFFNQMLEIVKNFQPQKIKYGFYTQEKFRKLILETISYATMLDGTKFINLLIDKINSGEIPIDEEGEIELSNGKNMSFDSLCLEYAKAFGYYYEEEEKKYRIDEELYEKSKKTQIEVLPKPKIHIIPKEETPSITIHRK